MWSDAVCCKLPQARVFSYSFADKWRKKIHSPTSVALYLNFQLNIPNIINKWTYFLEPRVRKLTKAQRWSRRATGALPVPVLTFVESAQLLFCYNLLCHPLWLTPQLTAQSAAGQGRRRTVPQDLYLFMSENDIATAEANQAITCALNWWASRPLTPHPQRTAYYIYSQQQ